MREQNKMIQPYDLPINKSDLWDIYNRCNRKEKYFNPSIASTTNVFIDDPNDIEYINNNIINPLGLGADKIYIPVDLIANRWDDGPWTMVQGLTLMLLNQADL